MEDHLQQWFSHIHLHANKNIFKSYANDLTPLKLYVFMVPRQANVGGSVVSWEDSTTVVPNLLALQAGWVVWGQILHVIEWKEAAWAEAARLSQPRRERLQQLTKTG